MLSKLNQISLKRLNLNIFKIEVLNWTKDSNRD